MINNRQAGRRRGRGGNNPGGGGGGPRQGGGRPDNGNRIDSRARGNASQLYEKYKNMASDAQRQGDRVNTEYYLQFADHYFRVLSEQRGRFEEAQPRRGPADFDFNDDNEFGGDFGGSEFVEGGERANDGGDQPMAQANGQRFDRDDRGRNDGRGDGRSDGQGEGRQQRDDRPRAEGRDDRPRGESRDDRPRGEGRDDRQRNEARDDRPRGEGRDDRPRSDARPERDDRPRGDREARRDAGADGRFDRPRGEQPDRETRRPRTAERQPEQPPVEVAGQRRAEPMPLGESLENRAEEVLEADRPLDPPPARRRGRPRRDAEPVAASGAQDNGADGASVFEADRLPPALTVAANDEAPTEAKPRRRRVRAVEDTPTAAE